MTAQDTKSDSSGHRTLVRQLEPEWSLRATDAEGRLYPISSGYTVGRDNCEILLPNPHASRRHARLTVSQGTLRVEDLGSANGTFVNGDRIDTAELEDEDVVRFDTLEFTVVGPRLPDFDPSQEESTGNSVQNETLLRPGFDEDATETLPHVEAPSSSTDAAVVVPPLPAARSQEETAVFEPTVDSDATVVVPPVSAARSQEETAVFEPNIEPGKTSGENNDDATTVLRGVDDPQEPSLVGIAGEWAGKVFNLTGDSITIGRMGSDIVLNEPSVSSKHAQFVKQGGQWKVVDLSSTSGTYVNGIRSQSSLLSTGDSLRLGRVQLRFVIDGSNPSQVLSEMEVGAGSGQGPAVKSHARVYIAVSLIALMALGSVFYFFY